MSESVAAAGLAGAKIFGGAREVILSESADAFAGASPAAGSATEGRPAVARGRLYADRYGRVSSLAALLRAEYAARPESGVFSPSSGGSVKYIGCFGLGGGCGASSVAIGVGRDFAAYKDRRALYVSLETLEANGLCMRRAGDERHIGDFMYLMLRGRDADLRLFFEACLFRDSYGLARFFPSPGLNDLARASPEESGDFFRFLDACGGFDIVVLDLGSECKDAVLRIVRLCDALVLVENGSLADTGKRERAAALLHAAWRRDSGGYPLRVENMLSLSYGADEEDAATAAKDAGGAKPARADGEERIEIGYDSASFRYFDDMTDFVLSNEFGLGIRKLADKLFARICE
jgi:hypothetical protein